MKSEAATSNTFVIDNIAKVMKVKKIKQKDLMDYLGINKSIFSMWKNGESNSYMKYLSQIAAFLETSPNALCGWKDADIPTRRDDEIIRFVSKLEKLSLDEIKRLSKIADLVFDIEAKK